MSCLSRSKKNPKNQENGNTEANAKEPTDTTYYIITMIAFAQGILGLSDLAINFLYKDDFQLSPAQVSVALSITASPWIVKPLWGAISDNIYLMGYRRKSYLLIFALLESVCWFLLGTYVTEAYTAIFTLFLIQLSVAFCNVIGEALLVEKSQDGNNSGESEENKQANASKNVSLFFGVRSIGVLLTAYSGGLLLEFIDKRTIFKITAIIPFLLACLSITLNERPTAINQPSNNNNTNSNSNNNNNNNGTSSSENFSLVFKFLKQPQILRPLIFILLFMMTPSTGSSMFYFYTNVLGLHPEFLGELRLLSSFATLTGIFVYNKWLTHVKFKTMMITTTLICTSLGMFMILLVTRENVRLGIPDKFLCMGDSLFLQMFAELNLLPILILCCRICPKNIEGTMYALLMATINLGSMISNYFGAFFMWLLGINEVEFGNLWLLVIIANLSMVLPLPMLTWVKLENEEHAEEENHNNIENEDNEEREKLAVEDNEQAKKDL